MMMIMLQLGWRNLSHLKLSKIALEISLTWKKLSSACTCLGLCIQVKVSLKCAELVDFSACFGAQVLRFLDSLNSTSQIRIVCSFSRLSLAWLSKILLLFLFCCSQKKVVQFFTHNNLFYVNPTGLISLAFLPQKKKTICSMFTQAI